MDDPILIVDDSATIRQTVKSTLSSMGYTNTHLASNGAVALEKCHAEPFKVIFLDWNMPGMDGLEFLKAYRNQMNIKDTAVIMLTAVADKKSVLMALECGATDYVTKPVSIEAIKRKMVQAQEWLASQAGASQQPHATEQPFAFANGKTE